ncbi:MULTISPECIES: DUF6211 family protein [unclassified Streptomyces]|uniref:DUF6211 family protein n=1 Tax=unclassified Streptomyces TaxID=2593676 RepID=UPI0033F698CC
MLDDLTPPAGGPAPTLGDIIRLHPGNRHGLNPDTVVQIVDVAEHLPGYFEVWHLRDHPAYWDWAAAITVADVADIITSDTVTLPEDLQ